MKIWIWKWCKSVGLLDVNVGGVKEVVRLVKGEMI
jgi:hypothetical protein